MGSSRPTRRPPGPRAARALAAACALAACAPAVDGPAERQRAIDRADSARLAAQLAALPGVVRADAAIYRPARDPWAPRAPRAEPPGSAAVVVVIDAAADGAAIAAATRALTAGHAPGAAAQVVVERAAPRPALARVGPFTVEEPSRRPLQLALALGLAVIAALASAVAWMARPRQRRGSRAQ